MNLFLRRFFTFFTRTIFQLGALVLTGTILLSTAARAEEADSDIKLVLIVTRHGVRTPLQTNEALGKFTAQPWPAWSEPVGYLTEHGKRQMVLMGQYYRQLYSTQGLLTGKADSDLPAIYFRADSDQRTIETARDLAAGLVPETKPDFHARPQDEPDPLFRPAKVGLGQPNRAIAVAELLGRVGGDSTLLTQSLQPAFATLRRVLLGEGVALPAGKMSVVDLPSTVEPGTADHTVDLKGPLTTGKDLTEALMLQYTDGMPMAEVGWGRVTPGDLTQLIQLHSLYFSLAQGGFYASQVQGSNLASHLLKTIDQAVSGKADTGALGAPGQKVVIVVGHDTNIINLGSLLRLSWFLPGTQANPVLPGGALVFELRQRRSDHQFAMRTYYVSQTLEQIRNLTPLTLQTPPALAPIFIPGCSEPSPGYDAPLAGFEALLRRVIDPQFVAPSPL